MAGLALKQNKHVLRASRGKGHHKIRPQGNYFISQILDSKTHTKKNQNVGKMKFNVMHLTIMLNLGIKGPC